MEPKAVPAYRIEFTQGKNYKLVKNASNLERVSSYKGTKGKLYSLNEDLPNPSYVFETEGSR